MEYTVKKKYFHGSTLNRSYVYYAFLSADGEDWPFCIPCQAPFTVEHFLIACTDFCITHSRSFNVNSSKEHFDTAEPATIFSFHKQIGICNKIKFR